MEGKRGRRVGLVVRCFSLDEAGVYVLGIGELVPVDLLTPLLKSLRQEKGFGVNALVKGVMFHGCTVEPHCAGSRLIKQATASIDGDLGQGGIINIVICRLRSC